MAPACKCSLAWRSISVCVCVCVTTWISVRLWSCARPLVCELNRNNPFRRLIRVQVCVFHVAEYTPTDLTRNNWTAVFCTFYIISRGNYWFGPALHSDAPSKPLSEQTKSPLSTARAVLRWRRENLNFIDKRREQESHLFFCSADWTSWKSIVGLHIVISRKWSKL